MAVKNRMNKTKTIALLGLMLSLTIIFCFVPIKFGPITLALMILPTLIVAQVCGAWTSVLMGVLMGLLNYIAWFTIKAADPIAPIFQNPLVCILPRVLIAVVSYWSRIGLETLIIKKCMKIDAKPETVMEDDEEEPSTAVIECGCEDAQIPQREDEIAIFDAISAECDNSNVENAEALLEEESAEADRIADDEAVENINADKGLEKSKKAKEIVARQCIHLVSTALGVITNTVFVAIFTLIFFNNTTLGSTIIDVNYILAWFGLNFAIEVVAFSLITPPIVLAIKAAKLV